MLYDDLIIPTLICLEKGEVLGDHYKLIPVDLRDLQKLGDIISLANMDPRYVSKFHLLVSVTTLATYCLNYLGKIWVFSLPSAAKFIALYHNHSNLTLYFSCSFQVSVKRFVMKLLDICYEIGTSNYCNLR